MEQIDLSGTNERCTEFCRRDEEILKSTDGTSDDVHSNAPLGFSDKSGDSEVTVRRSGRQNKSKAPSRYGSPVKHSVKLIKSQQVITDLNKAALEAYRMKLAPFRADANKPIESELGLSEKQLLRRKFGSEALDISRSWNSSWRVPLHFEEHTGSRENR